jgi:pimeloyl-ACP methyl ester carboxylesterase
MGRRMSSGPSRGKRGGSVNGRRGRRLAVVAVVLVLTAACTGGGSSREAFRPTLAWGSCPPDVEIQFLSRHRCGWLTVLQDRSEPHGKTIRLLVVKTWPVGVEPVGIASGFGSDIGNGYGYGDASAGATRLRQAGVGVELRGSGHSQPSLECPEVEGLSGPRSGPPASDPSLLGGFLSAVKACRDRLVAQGVDPADYDLQNAARDVEDLRVALGVDRWRFLSSYGSNSRFLFEYLREFPDRVGAVYVDSPQFPQIDEVTGGVRGTRRALDQLFEACSSDGACAKAYPHLSRLWARAMTRVERQPLRGATTVDGGTLLRAMRFAFGGDGPNQQPLSLSQLPATIAAAARGRITAPLAAAMDEGSPYCAGYRPLCLGVGRQGFSLGAYLTVLCRDEVPFIDRGRLSEEIGGDRAYRDVFGHDPYVAACGAWHVPPADPTVAQPVRVDVPLLMLVGQFDSYSSAADARDIAATLPRAWVVEVPGQTHNALGFSDCPIGIRNAWAKTPASPPAGTGCLNQLGVSFSTGP